MERYFQFYQTQDTSYRQDNQEKGYTIIDRGSTESGSRLPLPTFSSVVSNQYCLTPTFSCRNRWLVHFLWRLSMLMLSFICAKTHQTSAFSIRMVIRRQPSHRQRLNFRFDAVLIAYSLAFSGSIGCNSCSLPLSGFPCTTPPNPPAGFMGAYLLWLAV